MLRCLRRRRQLSRRDRHWRLGREPTVPRTQHNIHRDTGRLGHFQFMEASGQLAFQGLEGFIPYVDIDPQFQTPNHLKELNQAYPTCGGTPSDYPGHITNVTGTLDEEFGDADEWFGTTDEQHDQMDRNQEIPAVTNSNEGMFFDSTSATQDGDIVRGVVPSTTRSPSSTVCPTLTRTTSASIRAWRAARGWHRERRRRLPPGFWLSLIPTGTVTIG